jgi:spore cortex formation protein SpoVR/YcgB (stage V sporulation)
MMPEPITALRQAIETVRAQIPKGELTRGSVERLLEAAEAVCAGTPDRSSRPLKAPSSRLSKRQETRARWAEIARQNEKDTPQSPMAAE